MKIEIENLTKAQEMALEDLFATMVSLGSRGASRWVCFYADGDGNFRPKIKVNGEAAKFIPNDILSKEEREDTLWDTGEYRIDFDFLAGKLRNQELPKQ